MFSKGGVMGSKRKTMEELLQASQDDRRLYRAMRLWMNDVACFYDSPEIALRNGLELLETWGNEWIEEAKVKP